MIGLQEFAEKMGLGFCVRRRKELKRELSDLNKRWRQEQVGYVYIVKHQGLYKIGCSKNPQQRFRSFNTTMPGFEVIGVLKTDCMYEYERMLHRVLANTRVSGEWFDLDNASEFEKRYLKVALEDGEQFFDDLSEIEDEIISVSEQIEEYDACIAYLRAKESVTA